jgi:magnesium-transporting ATPase (P-type)
MLGTLGVLLALVILSEALSYMFETGEWDESPAKRFVMFCLLYNNLIPISMFVTIDIIRVIQIFFIQKDLNMFDPDKNESAVANITDVNDDLG